MSWDHARAAARVASLEGPYISKAAAAKLLGVSHHLITRALDLGDLTPIPFGRRIRIATAELLAYPQRAALRHHNST